MKRGRLPLAAALALVIALTTTGCLLVYDRNVSMTGTRVCESMLPAPGEGETTKDDVLRAFGEPTQTLTFADGREVLTYTVTHKANTQVAILVVLAFDTRSERIIKHSFEFIDGVLTRRWTDEM